MLCRYLAHCLGGVALIRSQSKLAVCLVALAAVAGPSGASAAASPAAAASTRPASKAAWVTSRDRYNQFLAWNRRDMVDRYRPVGNEETDQAARAMLDATARSFAAVSVPEFYEPADTPARNSLLDQGQKLLDAGCTAPMVRYVVAALRMDKHDLTGVQQLLQMAGQDMLAEKYPAFRIAQVERRLCIATPEQELAAAHHAAYQQWTAKALSGPLTDIERQHIANEAWDDSTSVTEQNELIQLLQATPQSDPWALNLLIGRRHIRLAWQSRGNDWGANVTPEGAKGFEDNLRVAAAALTRAWKAAPKLPDAPRTMITVAQGGGAELAGGSADVWFERTLQAQLDDTRAYYSMFNGPLLPRWGGSYEQILYLGEACRRNPFRNTIVPWQYVEAVKVCGEDQNQPWNLLSNSKVFQQVVQVAGQTAAELPPGDSRNYFLTVAGAAYWRLENWTAARQELDAVIATPEADINSRAFAYFGSKDPENDVAEIFARTGPAVRDLLEADHSMKEGRYGEVISRLDRLSSTLAPDDRSLPYFNRLRKEATARKNWDDNEWAETQWDRSLSNWTALEGVWTARADGSILGTNTTLPETDAETASRAKTLLWKGWDLADAFEISFKLNLLPYRGDTQARYAGVAIYCPAKNVRGFIGSDFIRRHASYALERYASDSIAFPKDGTDIYLRFDGNKFRFSVDGVEASKDVTLPPASYQGLIQFGLGSFEGSPETFSNVRIRRLQPLVTPLAAAPPPAPTALSMAMQRVHSMGWPTVIAGALGGLLFVLLAIVALKPKRKPSAARPVSRDAFRY